MMYTDPFGYLSRQTCKACWLGSICVHSKFACAITFSCAVFFCFLFVYIDPFRVHGCIQSIERETCLDTSIERLNGSEWISQLNGKQSEWIYVRVYIDAFRRSIDVSRQTHMTFWLRWKRAYTKTECTW